MKLLFKHELPKKIRYAKVYVEVANASLFVSIDGAKASWYGTIGDSRKKHIPISDKQYSNHRASSRVVQVVDQDDERIILKTEDGYEEEWVRPRWVLSGLRRARQNSTPPAEVSR